MERLKLLPLSQDSVEERVAAFRNFSDEVTSSSDALRKRRATLLLPLKQHVYYLLSVSAGAPQPV